MPSEKPIAEKEVLLKKFEGKGGWTYAEIPGIKKNKKKSLRLVKSKRLNWRLYFRELSSHADEKRQFISIRKIWNQEKNK